MKYIIILCNLTFGKIFTANYEFYLTIIELIFTNISRYKKEIKFNVTQKVNAIETI